MRVGLLVIAFVTAATAGQAAVLNMELRNSYSDSVEGRSDFQVRGVSNRTGLQMNETLDIGVGGTRATSNVNVNLAAGVMRWSTQATSGAQTSALNTTSNALARNTFSVSEQLTMTSDGTLNVSALVHGLLSRSDDGDLTGSSALSNGFLSVRKIGTGAGDTAGRAEYSKVLSSNVAEDGDVLSFAISELLDVTLNVRERSVYEIIFSTDTRSAASTQTANPMWGQADFLNTAFLSIGGTATWTASDAAFLSQMPPMSEVPLPAGLPLLLAGLGALGLLRRRAGSGD